MNVYVIYFQFAMVRKKGHFLYIFFLFFIRIIKWKSERESEGI